MNKEEIEEAFDIIIDAISKSNLSNYTKVELMINIKLFMENYDKSIRILRNAKHEEDKRFK